MAHVVVLGAGLAGVLQAYELKAELRKEDRLTVISKSSKFRFLPSNPWVAVNWRTEESVEVELPPIMSRNGIEFLPVAATKLKPEENTIELEDGKTVNYDYLVIATGPDLAFDEVEGLGPKHFTQSICETSHATAAGKAWESFVKNPGPVVIGAALGVSCFGPAYEFAFITETDLRKRRIRDKVPMTYLTSEPYVGHLGLDGVGDTKTLLESAMRDRHIKWITNSRIKKIEAGKIIAEELDEQGAVKTTHELPFSYSMIMPPFRGIPAIRGIEGLVNPRGFVIVDKFQRNPKFKNIYAAGVTVAIPPVGKTPVPVGVPKTGFMIESMVTAISKNISDALHGREPEYEPTWNAVCLADFGDEGVAFIAQPQIPPRNVNWSSKGVWVHGAKVGFEKYFLGKIRRGTSEPFYERLVLDLLGIRKLKEIHKTAA